MTMPAEGVTLLSKGLIDLAAVISYVCMVIVEYKIVRVTVCFVEKNSRRRPLQMAGAATCAPTTSRQLGLSLAEYLCAYFLSSCTPTCTFRRCCCHSLGFSTFSSGSPSTTFLPPRFPLLSPRCIPEPWRHSSRLLRLATNSSSAVFRPLCPKTFFGNQSQHGLLTRIVSGKVS